MSKTSTDMSTLTSIRVTKSFQHFRQSYSMIQTPYTQKRRNFPCGGECSPHISATITLFLPNPTTWNLPSGSFPTSIKVTRLYPHFSQSYSLSSPLESQKYRKLYSGDLFSLHLNRHHPYSRPTNHILTSGGLISNIY